MQTHTTDSSDRAARRVQRDNKRAAATKAVEPTAYVHQVIAPWVPGEERCNTQRYYSRGNTHRGVDLKSARREYSAFGGSSNRRGEYSSAEVEVYRTADCDTVQLRTEINNNWNQCETRVECTAAELREIAARLLDAAHDLEVNPAAKLIAEAS